VPFEQRNEVFEFEWAPMQPVGVPRDDDVDQLSFDRGEQAPVPRARFARVRAHVVVDESAD